MSYTAFRQITRHASCPRCKAHTYLISFRPLKDGEGIIARGECSACHFAAESRLGSRGALRSTDSLPIAAAEI